MSISSSNSLGLSCPSSSPTNKENTEDETKIETPSTAYCADQRNPNVTEITEEYIEMGDLKIMHKETESEENENIEDIHGASNESILKNEDKMSDQKNRTKNAELILYEESSLDGTDTRKLSESKATKKKIDAIEVARKASETTQKQLESNGGLNLGFIHQLLNFFFSATTSTGLCILWIVAINIINAGSDFSLALYLHTNGFHTQALIVLLTDYASLCVQIPTYLMTIRTEKLPWMQIILEISLLVICAPFAPVVSYILMGVSWLFKSKHEVRFHRMAKTSAMVHGLVESPVQLVVLSWLYLTGVLVSPWEERTFWCDSLNHCVHLGVVLPLISFTSSFLTLLLACLDARQTDGIFQKIGFIAFILPNVAFRLLSLILFISFGQEYIFIPMFLIGCINAGIAMQFKVKDCMPKQINVVDGQEPVEEGPDIGKVNLVTSALTSIMTVATIPENPHIKERNRIENSVKSVHQRVKFSCWTTLSSLLIMSAFVGLILVLRSFNPFHTNSNLILTDDQLRFLLATMLIPLFILTCLSSGIYLLFSLIFSTSGLHKIKLGINLLTILSTFLVMILSATHCPRGPEIVFVLIKNRDRVVMTDALSFNHSALVIVSQWNLAEDYLTHGNSSLHFIIGPDPQNLVKRNKFEIGFRRNISVEILPGQSEVYIGKGDIVDQTKYAFLDNLCFTCLEKTSNVCHNNLLKMLNRPNTDNIKQCGKEINGAWSSWKADENCTLSKEEIGEKCGFGYQLMTRKCQGRKFGGEHCKIDKEKTYFDMKQAKNFNCHGPPCPEWETRGVCKVERGSIGVQERVLVDTNKTILKRTNERCFTEETNAAPDFVKILHHPHRVYLGETVTLTCVSSPSFPATELSWKVGQEIQKPTKTSYIESYDIRISSEITLDIKVLCNMNLNVTCHGSHDELNEPMKANFTFEGDPAVIIMSSYPHIIISLLSKIIC